MKFASTVFLAVCAVAGMAYGQTVVFYTEKSCSGAPAEEFENVGCNVCVDPPGGTSLPFPFLPCSDPGLTSTDRPPACPLFRLLAFINNTLDWAAALITGIGSNQRWEAHNEVGLLAYGSERRAVCLPRLCVRAIERLYLSFFGRTGFRPCLRS